MPSIVISCCILSIHGYCRKIKRDRSRVNIAYQIMNREEQINETYMQNHFPIKYYLKNAKEACPICFDK